MDALERPTFAADASRELYNHVERHGSVARSELREFVSLSPEEFRTHLDRLKAEGYLEETDGSLRISLELGTVDAHETDDDDTVVIRPGCHADFDGLVDAIQAVTSEETYVIAESVAEQLIHDDAVLRYNPVTARVFFVATVDDDVVGWTHLDLPQVDHLQAVARQTVGVRSGYRGDGIGSSLLRRGVTWAAAHGYRKLYNSVPAVNDRALEFLDAHGWHTEAIRREHYRIDGELVDDVLMAYTVSLSTSEALYVVAGTRRRYLLYRLLETERTNVEAIVDQLAARGRDGAASDDDVRNRPSVRSALLHSDLPRLVDTDIVEYDRQHGDIARGPRYDEIRPVLERLRSTDTEIDVHRDRQG